MFDFFDKALVVDLALDILHIQVLNKLIHLGAQTLLEDWLVMSCLHWLASQLDYLLLCGDILLQKDWLLLLFLGQITRSHYHFEVLLYPQVYWVLG